MRRACIRDNGNSVVGSPEYMQIFFQFRDSNVAHMFVDDGCLYGLPYLLAARVACFSDVCRDRSLGAFNLLKTELAMIDRSQVDPNHRLLFANALAAVVDRGLFHVARLQLVADNGNPPSLYDIMGLAERYFGVLPTCINYLPPMRDGSLPDY